MKVDELVVVEAVCVGSSSRPLSVAGVVVEVDKSSSSNMQILDFVSQANLKK